MAKAKPKQRAGRDGNVLELVPARGHERYGKTEAVVRNVREHPMDTLLDRKTIEAYHHQAAEKFLRDWEISQIRPARAAPLEPSVDGGRFGDLSGAQADAMSRVNSAMGDLGRANRMIVTTLVVGRENLDQVGTRMRVLGYRWPAKRYAGPRVCEALHELAVHYGLATKPHHKHP
jgi:Domain of unknown function (DUF6456)